MLSTDKFWFFPARLRRSRGAKSTIGHRAPQRRSRLSLSLVVGFLGISAFPGEVAVVERTCDHNCFQNVQVCQSIDAACVLQSMAQVPRITSCTLARAECKLRLGLYQLYMERMAWGVSMHPLPQHYLRELAPYFPGMDLSQVRVGYSDRQPEHNATTDCKNIYFNDPQMVRQVIKGTLWVGLTDGKPDPEKTNMDWLFHELRHVEQCREWGGRDAYALRWMQDLSRAVMRQMSLEHHLIHNDQAMEKDADRVALDVLQKLAPVINERGQIRTR